jgi:hypothetical protein
MLKRSDYPKEVHVGDATYAVQFCRKMPAKNDLGETDPSTQTIKIKVGQGKEETSKTFIHELIHAVELEHDLEIPHKLVYALEAPLFQLLRDNFL